MDEASDIEFYDVSYAVATGFCQPKKRILHNVSGSFRSGELTALMGPSGAGKSSLLNILTGFKRQNVQGSLNFHLQHGECHLDHYKSSSCYIQQDDALHPLFSVQEAMWIACQLKLGRQLETADRQARIDNVLVMLDLIKAKSTRCGQLSGGQRKRLSIALELISEPLVMFLDEPTSGLDSLNSLQLIKILQGLAHSGRTIICTIHQPSATIYELFDYVYLLAEGRCLYQGEPASTVDHLKQLGLNCPKYHNPADYLIEIVSKEYGDFTELLAGSAVEREPRRGHRKPLELLQPSGSFQTETPIMRIPIPSELERFWVLLARCQVQLFRDWTVTWFKLALHVLVGVLLGVIYKDFGNNGSKAFDNILFLLVVIMYLVYTSLMPAILRLPSELPVLRKEHFNNWYRLRTYYAALLVSNLPVLLVMVFAHLLPAYVISGQLPEPWRFGMLLLVMVLVALVADGFGYMMGTIFNPVNGTFLGAVAHCVFMLFAGFLIFLDHMPRYMYYISFGSYLRYSGEAMVVAIYGLGRHNLPCPAVDNDGGLGYCQFRVPRTILKELALSDDHYWLDVVALLVHFVALRALAFLTLKRKLVSL